MAYLLTAMPGALRSYGLDVRLVPGWEVRGHGNISTPRGVLCHHTGTAAKGNFPSLNTVVSGRSDLPGPLCNVGHARDGSVLIVAAGLAYHAGVGAIPGIIPQDEGNNYLIGIESESAGTGDWTSAQEQTYPILVAALQDCYDLDTDRVWMHKGYALPPGRKVDAAHWPGDITGMRTAARAARDRHNIPRPRKPAPGATLRLGMSGPEVVWLQNQVNADLLKPPGVHVTGHFDQATRHAVARFQRQQASLRAFGTNPALAGLAGPKTIAEFARYSN